MHIGLKKVQYEDAALFASKYKIKRFYEFYQTTNIFRAAQLEQIKIDYLIEIFLFTIFFCTFLTEYRTHCASTKTSNIQ